MVNRIPTNKLFISLFFLIPIRFLSIFNYKPGRSMSKKQIHDFENILKKSGFLISLRRLERGKKSVLFGDSCRSLTDKEVAVLKAQGNRCTDWDQVRAAYGFMTEHIFDSVFSGKCVLGIFHGRGKRVGKSVELPSGIYKSNVINSEIGSDCLVSNTALLSNYIVKENAVIYQTQAMMGSGDTVFGNGTDIAVGPETGGRNVHSFAEITIPIAEAVATRRGDTAFQEAYRDFIRRYSEQCRMPFGVVEGGCLIWNTKKIEDVFFDKGVILDGADLVKNCTLLGTDKESTEISHGAVLKDTCVQWGSTITTGAVVEKCIITEHTLVERHAIVTHSIIGPNSVVGEGEITSSLVGPFIASHHQSLLIAAVWPGGKGNVGYGANVGSNHTSRVPDQEIHCGEGMFFGLGVNVKFPANFTDAPYTLIATGVSTMPQRVKFPFSLINTPSGYSPDIPPAYNEILPGWVLTNNIYMVKRNEEKFRERDLARRTRIHSEIFRAEIVDKMIQGRNLLDGVKKIQAFYTDEQISGVGKNILTEENRKKGLEAYGLYIEYYVLKGLMKETEKWILGNRGRKAVSVYRLKTKDTLWEHQRKILLAEGLDTRSCQENLERLVLIQERIAGDVKQCKEKDRLRGITVIPDYQEVATSVSSDPIIKGVEEETKQLRKTVSDLLMKISE
jgi:NDP-sugar pyrophosphorylase family protein